MSSTAQDIIAPCAYDAKWAKGLLSAAIHVGADELMSGGSNERYADDIAQFVVQFLASVLGSAAGCMTTNSIIAANAKLTDATKRMTAGQIMWTSSGVDAVVCGLLYVALVSIARGSGVSRAVRAGGIDRRNWMKQFTYAALSQVGADVGMRVWDSAKESIPKPAPRQARVAASMNESGQPQEHYTLRR